MAGNRETKTQRNPSKQTAKSGPDPTTANTDAGSPQTAQARSAFDATARHQMISEAAYYRAEKRGFAPGGEVQDWCEAESSIDDPFSRGSTH
ncbi:MAG TPA: DUF2934 domain-containing protein [Gammaproteobacteria bacterium]|jgi:hypothetical protein